MSKDPLIDQLWNLYKKIPEELQEAIFSVEVANSISGICEKNEIDKTHELAKIVGESLLGILPPKEVEETLKEKLAISPQKAQKVAREIDRFIFYPLKESLTELYGEEFKILSSTEKEVQKEKKKKKTPGKDLYRETFE
jgi:hypothetical protein